MINQHSPIQIQQTKMTITPQFKQGIALLQMSTPDLVSYVKEQSLENPLMDVKIHEDVYPRRRNNRMKGNAAYNHDNYLTDRSSHHTETLENKLLSQLRIDGVTRKIYKIARYLTGNLNESGYLTVTVEETYSRLQESVSDVEEALHLLQSLEPVGVGARTVQECLQIQILHDVCADLWAYPIVTHYINELAGGKLQQIAEQLCISMEQVQKSLAYIRSLNPRPGLAFSHQPETYISPDAIVRKDRERYVILMNTLAIPKVSINHEYRQLIQNTECPETKTFMRQSVHSAQWLISSLEQRIATLSRIIEVIVQEQIPFLEHGIPYLKPMTLRIVAERLDMHVSTISRAVRNKYIEIPWGIYDLKFFFSTGIMASNGSMISTESIKAKILQLIDGENKRKPLSDQKIADILAENGMGISRRTVVKYREEQQIICSRLRTKK